MAELLRPSQISVVNTRSPAEGMPRGDGAFLQPRQPESWGRYANIPTYSERSELVKGKADMVSTLRHELGHFILLDYYGADAHLVSGIPSSDGSSGRTIISGILPDEKIQVVLAGGAALEGLRGTGMDQHMSGMIDFSNKHPYGVSFQGDITRAREQIGQIYSYEEITRVAELIAVLGGEVSGSLIPRLFEIVRDEIKLEKQNLQLPSVEVWLQNTEFKPKQYTVIVTYPGEVSLIRRVYGNKTEDTFICLHCQGKDRHWGWCVTMKNKGLMEDRTIKIPNPNDQHNLEPPPLAQAGLIYPFSSELTTS